MAGQAPQGLAQGRTGKCCRAEQGLNLLAGMYAILYLMACRFRADAYTWAGFDTLSIVGIAKLYP